MAGITHTQKLRYLSQRNELKRNTAKFSHGEHSRLKVTSAGPKLQETQGDDKRDDDVDEQASVDVVRGPPQSDEGPLGNGLHLEEEWGRVPRDIRLVLDRFLEAVRLDPFDLLDGLLKLGGIVPNVGPVTVTNTWGKSSTNGIEHVLCGVDIVGANSSMTSKILSNGRCVLANISEVDLYGSEGIDQDSTSTEQ